MAVVGMLATAVLLVAQTGTVQARNPCDDLFPLPQCRDAGMQEVAVLTAAGGDYDTDGDGLIEIRNLDQLSAIRFDLDGDGVSDDADYASAFPNAPAGMGCPAAGCAGYELAADLDFDTNGNGRADSGDTYWNGGIGWVSMGTISNKFDATFDGGGHTISNLYINQGGINYVGLFGHAGPTSLIQHVGLVSVGVTAAGGVGGLVGLSEGTVADSYATGTVSGREIVGGLVGNNKGTVAASYTAVSVSGEDYIGGLVGDNDGVVTASHTAGSVTGDNYVGGLVGDNDDTITASYATGNVSGKQVVGGLVGISQTATIMTSYATGSVTGDNYVGGLIGYGHISTVTASYASGSASGNSYVGGLMGGSHTGIITASYAAGHVSGNNHVGGLMGSNNFNSVTVSYWDTQATGQADSAGGEGKSTQELQSPTGYQGIYAGWNVDLDDADRDNDLVTGGDDPWDFGANDQYPILRFGASAPEEPLPSVPRLYWVDEATSKIQRTNEEDYLIVDDLATSASGLSEPGSIALDPSGGKMYWTDDGAGQIRRSDLDGSNVESLVSGLADPVGIALNLTAGQLYWADRTLGGIYRGNFADISDAGLLTSYESLIANLDRPYQIVLDTAAGHMYWTERGGGASKIRRADLNGQNVTSMAFGLVAPLNPFGLSLDPVAGKMYWTERSATADGEDVIARADLDGQNGEIVISSAYHSLSGIAVDVNDGKIYWTDEQTGTVRRTDPADPNRAVEAVVTGLSAPEGIAISGPFLSRTRLALTALYRATGGPDWDDDTNWLSAEHPGTWHGVTTDEKQGIVVELNLRNNRLTGEIPPALGKLNNLELLNLSGNRLTGTIPAELSNLSVLKTLVLSENELNGPIPTGLGNHHLTSLKLSRNQLSGTISPEFSNLVRLRWLDLSDNRLTGPIPTELSNLVKLKRLNLSNNQLSGMIPHQLSSFDDLAGCETIGQIALTQQALDIFQGYSGSLANLQTLDLSDNRLIGTIPPMLCSLADLQVLDLGYNRLKGTIPAELGKLAELRVLRLDGQSPFNQYVFSGHEEEERLANCQDDCYLHGEIPPQLGQLTKLEDLTLSDNRLSGTIPAGLGGLLTVRSQLQTLDLSHNQLTGAIPAELSRLKYLISLNLSNNDLGEEIPYLLGNLVELDTLDLSDNSLRGEIPAQVVNLPSLEHLYLLGNDGFTGCVKITPQRAKRIGLSIDGHGVPPTCAVANARLHEKKREYAALQDLYNATGGDDWTNSNNRWDVTLDIYDQSITLGSFADEFDYSQWHGVVVGDVRDDDDADPVMRVVGLRLNDNNLQGNIPLGLREDLPYLEYLTLGGNPLEGCIPTGLSPALAVGEGFRDPDFTLANHEPGLLTAVTTATAQAAITEAGAQNITKDLLQVYSPLEIDTAKGFADDYLETGIEITNAVVRVFQSSAVKLNVPICPPPAPEPPIPGPGKTQTGDTDREILLKVKEKFVSQCMDELGKEEEKCIQENKFGSWRADNQWSHSNWLFDSGWHGVQVKGGRVTRLSLDDRNLQGPIPPELGGLGELKYLNLSGNRLTGPIPSELANLSNLETLGLNNNKLANTDEEGGKTLPPIPPELGNLRRLQEFNVQVNELEGWLPLELSMLTRHSLTQMDLDREGDGQFVVEGCLPSYSWATSEAALALADLGIDVAVTVGAAIAAGPTFGATAPGAAVTAVKVTKTAKATYDAIKGARVAQIGSWAARTAPRSAKFVKRGADIVKGWEKASPVVFGVTVSGGKEFAKEVSEPMVESALEAYGGPIGRAYLTDISLTEFLSDLSGKGAIIMGKVWCGD